MDPAATAAGTLEETLKSVESLLRQTLDAHQGWKSSSQTKVKEPFSELSSHLAFGMFLQFIVRIYKKADRRCHIATEFVFFAIVYIHLWLKVVGLSTV